MRKLWLLIGAGAGYVLGARAGRERYDQIAEKASQVWGDPRIQSKVEEVKQQAPQVAGKVSESAKSATGKAKSKAGGNETLDMDGSYENATGSYDPESGYQVDTEKLGGPDTGQQLP